MIRIECESEDLSSLFNTTVEARTEANSLRDRLYKEEDKTRDLKDEVYRLKNELARAVGNPPKADYAPSLRDLISHCQAGNKIACIKLIREMTGLGLKEAKDCFEAGYDKPAKPYAFNG